METFQRDKRGQNEWREDSVPLLAKIRPQMLASNMSKLSIIKVENKIVLAEKAAKTMLFCIIYRMFFV